MSKFNKTIQPEQASTTNLAGGQAYEASAEWKLVSLLLTSFVRSQFYRSEENQTKEISTLLKQVDPKFAAQAAIYARTEFGMRSITHILAAELAQYASGKEWSRQFYNQIVFRPDDMTEILSYFWANLTKGNKIPNAMRAGFSQAFNKFDEYQIAKYRNDGKEVSLVDVVNLVHPKPTSSATKEALRKLVKDELRNEKTWESKLSNTGQVATTTEELSLLKADVWKGMLERNELGYLALLRNLKNIYEQAPECVELACSKLTDANWINHPKNLVFPSFLVS